MKKYKLISLAILTSLLGLTSCNQQQIFKSKTHVDIQFTSHNAANSEIIDPAEIKINYTLSSIEPNTITNRKLMPSTGTVNMLVVPVIIPGYEVIDLNNDGVDDKNDVFYDLAQAFYCTDKKTSAYESVYSFYKQSSYGALNIATTITKWFDVATYSSVKFNDPSEITREATMQLAKDISNWVISLGYDMSIFDSNFDGYIDAMTLVYSAPQEKNNGPVTSDNNFTTYTTWANNEFYDKSGNIKKPADKDDKTVSCFTWASYDCLYENYGPDQIDTHTFIHEVGHCLGLNDYSSEDPNYSPLGKVDMMDGGITDHNSYSKILLGWERPYVILGSGKIRLDSYVNRFNCIVIPFDNETCENYIFNPFSEYLLVELYTNEANSYLDSTIQLNNNVLAPNSIGIRVTYVNKTLYCIDMTGEEPDIKVYTNQALSEKVRLCAPITNSREENIYNTEYGLSSSICAYDEIRTVESNGFDTFSNGGYLTDDSLFHENDSFDIQNHKSVFKNGLFNNSEECKTTFNILGVYDKR